tara:strand:+ start:15282 stop:15941 length:660 start_codon:yes stop_codon:yes gene_type:complete
MLEGLPFEPWGSPEIRPLALGVFTLLGVWALQAGFEREATRWKWSWQNPRKLTLRNAAETPRTLGVLLSHVVASTGLASGLTWLPVGWDTQRMLAYAALWMVGGQAMKWGGARLAFDDRDLASTMSEMNRHGNTWTALALGTWSVIAAIQPTLSHGSWSEWIASGIFILAMTVQAIRTSTLLPKAGRNRLFGILYLCILEWGWVALWSTWSIAPLLKGH